MLALVLVGCADGQRDERRPNLVFVVADTLRTDALSVHGGETPTPNIDRLAGRGVRFDLAYSHVPVTGPSHASMFTGLRPEEHGALINTNPLPEGLTTLAEVLQREGYRTAAVISLGVLRSRYGFAQGFDFYEESFTDDFHRPGHEVTAAALAWLAQDLEEPFFLWVHYSDPHEPYSPPTETFPVVEAWLNFRYVGDLSTNGYRQRLELELDSGENSLVLTWPRGERHEDRPLELKQIRVWNDDVVLAADDDWLRRAARGPTSPATRWHGTSTLPVELILTNQGSERQTVELTLLCHEEYTDSTVRRRYAQETAYLDLEIGKLTAGLEQLELLDDAVVVFTSDHGEGLGDHGLTGHIHQVYESLIRVPLFLAAPGRLPAGRVIDLPVTHSDLLPTLLELLAIDPLPGISGSSLLPLASDEDRRAARPVLAATYRPLARSDQRSLLRYPFKYIVDLESGQEELYDLSRDPGESRNLIAERPEIAAELAGTLRLARESVPDRPTDEAQSPELTQEEIDKLEALGYVN
jgi:arylsulfatase A-like enzyme